MAVSSSGFLDKERIIASPGFNRWLVPPAALAIHLCIGKAYGFSVFWLPLSRALGIKEPLTCGPDMGFWAELFTTRCDWRISTLGWMYTLFFVLFGSSAAIWGGWLERAGPRKAGVASAWAWAIFRRFPRSSNGFLTAGAWPRAWLSWVLAAAP